MAGVVDDRIGVEPEYWYLIFHRRSSAWWVQVLALGEFDHVSAIGWLPDQRVWVQYDVTLGGTVISVLPDCQGACDRLAALTDGNTIVLMPARRGRMWWRPGFWCVPAMAHLVGLGFVARPDGLYRKALRSGGAIVRA